LDGLKEECGMGIDLEKASVPTESVKFGSCPTECTEEV
jgi:hypothetical protein